MRVGLIGVGRIGAFHARTLGGHPEVTSLVLADADSARAGALADELGADVAPRVDDIFGDVQALVIAAPTEAHAELISRAADARTPAFCEKPIAADLESTSAVVEHVREAGSALQIGFQRRFDAGFRNAKDLVDSGRLGTLYLVRVATHDEAPPHESYIPGSGGIFRDTHSHDFDAIRFVTGQEVEEVYADGAVRAFDVFATYGDVDSSVGVMKLSGGALGIVSGARHEPLGYDVRMELLGSGDSVVVGWNGRTPLRSLEPDALPLQGPAYASFIERFSDAYRAELDAFVDVALGRRESPCTAEDAREALRIGVACDLSRAEHRPVRLEEIE